MPEPEYDEDGNRRIVDEDEDMDTDEDRDEDGTDNDDTFYGSYSPEADIKDMDEELADE